MKKFEKQIPRNYILVGDEKTVKIALDNLQWGFSEKSKGLWNKSEIGEEIAFYVTKPIQKIIGFGVIQNKIVDNKLIWPDELFFKKSLWPYRFQLKLFLNIENWDEGVKPPLNMMLNVGRKVIEKKEFLKLKASAKKSWNVK